MVVVGLLLVVVVVLVRPHLDPDTELYASGSLGIFPSPLGRVAGLGGYWTLSAVSVLSAVALVALCRTFYGAVALVLSPTFVWCIFPGVDALGALLVVVAVGLPPQAYQRMSWRGRRFSRDTGNESDGYAESLGLTPLPSRLLYPSRPRSRLSAASAAAVLAPLAHASTLPVSVVLAARRSALLSACIFAGGLALLPLTPYLVDISSTLEPRSVAYGALTVLFVGLPLVYAARVLDSVPVAAATVLAVAIVQADDPGTVTRYALPLAAVLCCCRGRGVTA